MVHCQNKCPRLILHSLKCSVFNECKQGKSKKRTKVKTFSQSVSHWRSLEVIGCHWRSLVVIGGQLRLIQGLLDD